jgi:hypothetical protein
MLNFQPGTLTAGIIPICGATMLPDENLSFFPESVRQATERLVSQAAV